MLCRFLLSIASPCFPDQKYFKRLVLVSFVSEAVASVVDRSSTLCLVRVRCGFLEHFAMKICILTNNFEKTEPTICFTITSIYVPRVSISISQFLGASYDAQSFKTLLKNDNENGKCEGQN